MSKCRYDLSENCNNKDCLTCVLNKIEEEINSPNRGTCDYFIVDRIEEIINKYKAESLEQEPCEDAVSRQAALSCLTATKLKKFDFVLHAREEIKKLPPVTPKPKTGHWSDYCPNCGARIAEGSEKE